MSLPPRFLDELRQRLALSEVVGRRVRLQRAGREYKACCPFHKEKSPSFYVNDDKGFYHCFGCGAHGDAIAFLMNHDNLEFMEAVERLAGEVGLEVPKPSPRARQEAERQKGLHELVEAAARFFSEQLAGPAGRQARDYLARRGVDEAMVARFRLGYAPGDGKALLARLKAEGFSEDQAIEAGLARRPDDGRAAYAFFRDRLMFPVSDRRGRVVAFGGRILSAEGGPKYLNSPDTPLFHKGDLLYGLTQALSSLRDGARAVVVEGYLDVIALHQHGIEGAVAPLGTALTERQVKLLWSVMPAREDAVSAPVVCFDGDEAGRRAAERMVARVLPILEPNRSVRVALLPPGEDPDTLVRGRDGGRSMEAVLGQARPLIDFLWAMATEAGLPETPEGRAGLRKRLTDACDTIADKTIRQLYVGRLLDRFYQETRQAGDWKRGGGRGTQGPRGAGPGAGGAPTLTPPRPASRDAAAVAILLHHPELFDEFAESLDAIDLGEDETLAVLRYAGGILADSPGLDGDALIDRLIRFDPGLAPALERLRRAYTLHGGVAGRDSEGDAVAPSTAYRREILRDVLRHEQIARLRREIGEEAARLSDGNDVAGARLARYQTELARLLDEQSAVLARLDADAFREARIDTGRDAA
ncbi:MAG: DNA primase [Azospirillaceae bacterium]